MSGSRKRRPRLSRAEFEIMQVVWSIEEATINDVVSNVNKDRKTPLKRATIQVQLRRLESKKWLTHSERGRVFYYKACVGRQEASADLADDLRQRVFDGSCAELIRCLFDREKLSDAEIDEIKSLIETLEPGEGSQR